MPGEISSGMLCSRWAVRCLSSLYIVGILIKLTSYMIRAVYFKHTFFSMQKLHNYQFKVRRKKSKDAIFGELCIFCGGHQ